MDFYSTFSSLTPWGVCARALEIKQGVSFASIKTNHSLQSQRGSKRLEIFTETRRNILLEIFDILRTGLGVLHCDID